MGPTFLAAAYTPQDWKGFSSASAKGCCWYSCRGIVRRGGVQVQFRRTGQFWFLFSPSRHFLMARQDAPHRNGSPCRLSCRRPAIRCRTVVRISRRSTSDSRSPLLLGCPEVSPCRIRFAVTNWLVGGSRRKRTGKEIEEQRPSVVDWPPY